MKACVAEKPRSLCVSDGVCSVSEPYGLLLYLRHLTLITSRVKKL